MAELSTHENQRVTKALNDGLQAALTGNKISRAGDEGRAGRGGADFEAVSVTLARHGRACPGHPRLRFDQEEKTWMPGTRPGMTGESGDQP